MNETNESNKRAMNRLTQKEEHMSKYVYTYGGGAAERRADMKALLGGKGANLAEMN